MSQTYLPSRRFVTGAWALSFAAAALGLAALALAHDPPGGNLVMTTDFREPHPFISALKPADRVPGAPGGPMVMKESPVYFDVKPPSDFSRVTVTLTLAPTGAGQLAAGAMATTDGRFLMQSAWSRLLETMPWSRLSGSGLVLYQANRDYQAVDDFFLWPPPTERLAVSGLFRRPSPVLAAYRPSHVRRSYDLSARGSHVLYAYLGAGEPLNLHLSVQDMNRTPGADPVRLSVFAADGGGLLANVALPDDGDAGDDWHSSPLRDIGLTWEPPRPGLYYLAFDATDDVFIRRLATTQSRIGFVGRLYVGDEVGYRDASAPFAVTVAGRRLQALAPQGDGLQDLAVGPSSLRLAVPGERVTANIAGPTTVTGRRRNYVLETDGLIALSPDALVPVPYVVDETTAADDLVAHGISCLLAAEPAARSTGGTVVLTADYDVTALSRTEDGAYRFVIDAPGLGATGGQVTVRTARLTWHRAPLAVGAWLKRLLAAPAPTATAEPEPFLGAKDFDEHIP